VRMVLGIATRCWEGWAGCVAGWQRAAWLGNLPYDVVFHRNVLDAYQDILERAGEEIIGYVHDDLKVFEYGWDTRVLREFSDPSIGMVGFGGALRHGSPNLYVEPYQLAQLGRFGFRSNMRNAEEHGERFAGECDVAVLDGFAMFVRRSILEKAGGWPLSTAINYFAYDYWLSCEVRRQGYRIRLVGVDCDHISGKTASMVQLKDDHAAAHLWLYKHSRDVLPYSVEEK